jgi:hypothetical protein
MGLDTANDLAQRLVSDLSAARRNEPHPLDL